MRKYYRLTFNGDVVVCTAELDFLKGFASGVGHLISLLPLSSVKIRGDILFISMKPISFPFSNLVKIETCISETFLLDSDGLWKEIASLRENYIREKSFFCQTELFEIVKNRVENDRLGS